MYVSLSDLDSRDSQTVAFPQPIIFRFVNYLLIVYLLEKGPQSRGLQDRRNVSSGPIVPPIVAHVQQTVTPEPSGTVFSATYQSDFTYAQTSSDHLSPSASSSLLTNPQSLPPPPPLEVFGYPHDYYPEGEPEEAYDRRRHRSSEDIDLDSSGQFETLSQRSLKGATETVDKPTEFKHFASMAAVFQSSSGGSSQPPEISIEPARLLQSTSSSYHANLSVEADRRYSDQYDRVHHSSSSSNSLAFSPPEFGRRGHVESRSTDGHQPLDFRPSSNLIMGPVVSSYQSVSIPDFSTVYLSSVKSFVLFLFWRFSSLLTRCLPNRFLNELDTRLKTRTHTMFHEL